MSLLEDVRNDRDDLARVLKKHRGIRKRIEDLYPDSAHFIYELLQNAEDTGAKSAEFELTAESLVFQHNGRPFTDRDIWAITDIGEGTKAEDDDKIGCFGVGFKAVFVYCETPSIWSSTYSFRITDFVLPHEISDFPDLGKVTRFEFPFNNPKKPTADAYREVLAGLRTLAETTLLFLTHLETIRCAFEGQVTEVLRSEHRSNHVEILKHTGGQATSSAHFLRFLEPASGSEQQSVAVAFDLGVLPDITDFNPRKPLAKQLRIVPSNPGRVAVFFPAEKEVSGLRFHVHAPFVSELSRASVKETKANEPLFRRIASLSAASLHKIRDLGLLTGDFLTVLPNSQDVLPARYQPIRQMIVTEMNSAPLTPVHGGKSHMPAKHLLQARASLKALLSDQDVEYLVDYEDVSPQWAIGAAQKNSPSDRFLDGLAIKTWDLAHFVELIQQRAADMQRWAPETQSYVIGPDPDFAAWLSGKPVEWFQQFYALLEELLASAGARKGAIAERFGGLNIVRLGNGGLGKGRGSYFPVEGSEFDEILPRVALGAYSSGRSKKVQQEAARRFLEAIGVREVGETEEVEAILKSRYVAESFRPNDDDLRRFIALVEGDPKQAELFADFYIFERTNGEWGTPSLTFLDVPFLNSGVSAYYGPLAEELHILGLAEKYQSCGVATGRIVAFASLVGARQQLKATRQSVNVHPNAKDLRRDYGYNVRKTESSIDMDWTIPHLERLLSSPSIELSRLVWRTMIASGSSVLKARFRPNQRYFTQEEDSSLVLLLRGFPWVPQGLSEFVVPRKASRDFLPEGFPFDPGEEWLQAIGFGGDAEDQVEERQRILTSAKAVGFKDDRELAEAKWFVGLDPAERQRIRDEAASRHGFELPDHEPLSPDERAKRVEAKAHLAPGRKTELRVRSVALGLNLVKEEAEQYLRHQYTNNDGQMTCQICKAEMPFRLASGVHYFEKVQLLRGLEGLHRENYLALCPNDAARFLYANGSEDALKDELLSAVEQEVDVVLAGTAHSIYFTQTHLADLRAVIRGVGQQLSERVQDPSSSLHC